MDYLAHVSAVARNYAVAHPEWSDRQVAAEATDNVSANHTRAPAWSTLYTAALQRVRALRTGTTPSVDKRATV